MNTVTDNDIEELLTKEEIQFVKDVILNPGCKLSNVFLWIDDGSEYGTSLALWKKPEELGLIECVGSYKWVPKNVEIKLIKRIKP